MTSDRDETHMNDLLFDYAVESKFGNNTFHVSNFDHSDKSYVYTIVGKIDGVFIASAMVGTGIVTDEMFGVYANTIESITKFWEMLRKVEGNYAENKI